MAQRALFNLASRRAATLSAVPPWRHQNSSNDVAAISGILSQFLFYVQPPRRWQSSSRSRSSRSGSGRSGSGGGGSSGAGGGTVSHNNNNVHDDSLPFADPLGDSLHHRQARGWLFPDLYGSQDGAGGRMTDVCEVRSDGSVSQLRLGAHDIADGFGLEPLDLLSLERDSICMVQPRGVSLIIALAELRLVVKADSALVLLPHNTRDPSLPAPARYSGRLVDFAEGLGEHLRDRATLIPSRESPASHITFGRSTSRAAAPFERVVLECALYALQKKLSRRLASLRLLADDILHQVNAAASMGDFVRHAEALSAMGDSVESFEQVSELTVRALERLLSDAEDLQRTPISARTLAAMSAAEAVNESDMAVSANVAPLPPMSSEARAQIEADADQVEVILETYALVFEELAKESRGLARKLATTQHTAELLQNNHRNRLLGMELQVAMGSLAAGLAVIWPSLFGMNLNHGIPEDHPAAFWQAVAVSVATGAVVYGGLRAMAQGRGAGLSGYFRGPRAANRMRQDAGGVVGGNGSYKSFNGSSDGAGGKLSRDAALELHDVVLAHMEGKRGLNNDSRGLRYSSLSLKQDEFRALLGSLHEGGTLTTEQLESLWVSFDFNRDGLLDYSDVLKLLASRYTIDPSAMKHHSR